MTVRDELAHAGAPAVGDALDPSAMCRASSLDELHTIADRGAHGGDLYFAAAAELERRARESDAAAHATLVFAMTKSSVNGTDKASNQAKDNMQFKGSLARS